jgi:hypothetical protein
MIPTGNLSTPNTADSTSFFRTNGSLGIGLELPTLYWSGVTSRATALTTQWFVEQRIPDLSHTCGPNCHYKVHVPSFVFKCTPNPSSLPYVQAGDPIKDGTTLWNGTMDPSMIWGFYIAWKSNGQNGTSGNASCLPFQAQYDVEVRTIALSTSLSLIFLKVQTSGGVQFVSTNITQMTSAIPNIANTGLVNTSDGMINFWMQLVSISYARKALFLGSVVVTPGSFSDSVLDDMQGQPSFLEIPVESNSEYVWGDVLKGIEEMSHNVTAALLTLQLGNMSSECFFDQQVGVYQYTSFALWAPYGVSTDLYSHVMISSFPHYVL